MQKARRHRSEERLRPLVSVWFQVYFTPLIGELFTFQSPYWLTIGHRVVFSLGGWAPRVQTEFHELDPTLGLPHSSLQDFHLLWYAIQAFHGSVGLSGFARRYFRNRGCFLFLWLLRCFSSPGSLPYRMHSGMDDRKRPGFPIQKSADQGLVAGSPQLIAGSHVFRRLSMPRHPPYALCSLLTPTVGRTTRTWRPRSIQFGCTGC